MIAKLKGVIESAGADHAVIDVDGVGYLVAASARTLRSLGGVGAEAEVHTEMLVSDDAIRLIGFATAEERDWYRHLTAIQGVGGKVALAILSALSAEELRQAAAAGDQAMVARAQGVGPKLAQRIVNELKDKAGAFAAVPGGAAAQPGSANADAVSALINLGFKPAAASAAVAKAEGELGREASLDALVRVALKKAAR
ncbi:MAG: Holliday junction branch migration protein RuvA [Sphingomonadaceae bacterium]